MPLTEEQRQRKTRVYMAIRESGKKYPEIVELCPSINTDGYLAKLMSLKTERILKKDHVREIAKVIGEDFNSLWYGNSELLSNKVVKQDTTLTIEEYITKHIGIKIDEVDADFLRSAYSKGNKLHEVPEEIIEGCLVQAPNLYLGNSVGKTICLKCKKNFLVEEHKYLLLRLRIHPRRFDFENFLAVIYEMCLVLVIHNN